MFTDIADSTRMKAVLGDREASALLQKHHAAVRRLLGRHEGAAEKGTAGDSFFLAFPSASIAARFALELLAELKSIAGPGGLSPQVRIGIHVGEVLLQADKLTAGEWTSLYGVQVDICARVMSLAEPGQVLMTRFAFDTARQGWQREETEAFSFQPHWVCHGRFLVKGVDEPVEICEVSASGEFRPPGNKEKAERCAEGGREPVAGWRPGAGQKIPGSDWQMIAPLGIGAFGEVWLGRHEKLKEERVFKFCFRADQARSLKREMTLFRVLKDKIGDHPHIVRLHDVFLNDAPFYLVVEHVPGKDLGSWAEERRGIGTVPLDIRLGIVKQIARALEAAHNAEIIHRDLKPGNILIDDRAGEEALTAKLSDFGIGQVTSEEILAGYTGHGFTQTLLAAGGSSQIGTMIYMAPELFLGKAASKASDIYSLGVLLFQMVRGHLSQPVSIDWASEIADEPLREDIRACIAHDPSKRLASAGLLVERLEKLPERRRMAKRARLQARVAASWKGALTASAGAAALLLWLAWPDPGFPLPVRQAGSLHRRCTELKEIEDAGRDVTEMLGDFGVSARGYAGWLVRQSVDDLENFGPRSGSDPIRVAALNDSLASLRFLNRPGRVVQLGLPQPWQVSDAPPPPGELDVVNRKANEFTFGIELQASNYPSGALLDVQVLDSAKPESAAWFSRVPVPIGRSRRSFHLVPVAFEAPQRGVLTTTTDLARVIVWDEQTARRHAVFQKVILLRWAASQQNGAVARAVHGSGRIILNSATNALKVGVRIQQGGRVETDDESSSDLFLGENGPVLRVHPNSSVLLEKLILGPEKNLTEIRLDRGRIEGSFAVRGDRSYIVRTDRFEVRLAGRFEVSTEAVSIESGFGEVSGANFATVEMMEGTSLRVGADGSILPP